MDVVQKLHSFDADIRYMGLSDMQKAIAVRRADPGWSAAVVTLLADTALEVQNLAIRVVAELATLEAAELVELILASTAPPTVRAVALKAIIQRSRVIPRDAVQSVLALLRKDAVFDTIEGAEAVIELLNHSSSRVAFRNYRTPIYEYAVQLTSHPGLLRMRGFDVLALVIPTLSKADWDSYAHQFVCTSVTTMRDPAAMGLVSKIAGAVPPAWLIPELEDILHISANVPADVDVCEAALEALASLYNVEGFDQSRGDALAQRLLRYSDYGGKANGESGSSSEEDMDWDGASDDSDWFDESSRVRKAAAKLAGNSPNAATIRDVVNAAVVEHDESARSTMYTVITAASASHAGLELPLDALARRVLKDVAANNWTAVNAGTKVLASWGSQPLAARIVREAATKRPALLHQYISLIRGPSNDDARWILKRALDADIATVPETAIHALNVAAELSLSQFALDAARLINSTTYAEQLRIAALQATGTLCSPADWPAVIPLVLHGLRAEPALRPAALDCLEKAAVSNLATEQVREIVFAINEILNVGAGALVTARSFAVLAGLPDSVAPEIVQTVLGLKSRDHRNEQETVLMRRETALQPAVLDWALANEALDLLRFLAIEGDRRVTDAALARSDKPEIHAAAAGKNWRILDDVYKFSATTFSELSPPQLRTLLALAQTGIEWDWYSVAAMLDSSFETNADLKGSIVGLMAVNMKAEEEYLSKIKDLAEEALERSFTAYASRTGNKRAVFDAAKKHAQLRIPSSLAMAITSKEDLSEFLTSFKDETAENIIATIKLLHGPVLVHSLPTLVNYTCNASLDSDTRAEACMTLAWIIQTVEEAHTIGSGHEVLNAFAVALVPRTSEVQTVNIGPFKHRVDKNLPLRQAAINGIYTCAGLVRLNDYRDIVDAVVDHGMRDEFEVKVVAFRAISILAELDSEAVRERQNTISVLCDAELSKKLKDNAVKEDVERHSALVTTINKMRGDLASRA